MEDEFSPVVPLRGIGGAEKGSLKPIEGSAEDVLPGHPPVDEKLLALAGPRLSAGWGYLIG